MTDATPPEETSRPDDRVSRRRLIQGGAALAAGGALAAYLPVDTRKAMAAAVPTSAFDPTQVKHIVLLMQENRSFDHYFGTMSGVRGFGDPTAMKLGTGRSVFYQPDPANPDGYLLPYHIDSLTSSAQNNPSLSHAWQIQHESWNHGNMDGWLRAHIAIDGESIGPGTMGYFEQADIPFHWALANAFTICDNYHCSVLGKTEPNRRMWLTGTIDPNGLNGGPGIDAGTPSGGFTWTTTAERLQQVGISWKCYQQVAPNGLNILHEFKQFLEADPSSALYQSAFGASTRFDGTPATDPAMAFEEDCAAGTLPTVSWLFAADSKADEHPPFLPAAGAQWIASKINALAANEDLWNSTVFILNYDENDGLFDHVPPPTPPAGTPDEFVTLSSPGGTPGGGLPIGAGFRVPCIIVSPWTVGGYVCSEPFDHTSILQFIERVTGITETNISAWRRQTFGDMTSAFQAVAASPPSIPEGSPAATAAELAFQTAQKNLPRPTVPAATQTFPIQDPGTRPSVG